MKSIVAMALFMSTVSLAGEYNNRGIYDVSGKVTSVKIWKSMGESEITGFQFIAKDGREYKASIGPLAPKLPDVISEGEVVKFKGEFTKSVNRFDIKKWDDGWYKQKLNSKSNRQVAQQKKLYQEAKSSGIFDQCIAKTKELIPVQQKIQEIADKRKYASGNSAVLQKLEDEVDRQQEIIMNVRYAFEKLGCKKYEQAIKKSLAH